MREKLIILLLGWAAWTVSAQTGNEVFSFLRLPNATRANALGGHTVALIERDPSLVFHNPGLLGAEMDGMINFNYMNYIADVNVGSALFTKAIGERAAWGVGASFMGYGNIQEFLPDNSATGATISAKDISVTGFYAHDLSERWRGGLSLKFLYSGLADFTSIGLAVDAGLSYYNSEKGFSFGFALKNIGLQIKPYEDDRQKMPWDIQAGVTQKMAHAPIRFSLTAQYLNRWKFDTVDNTVVDYEGDSFFKSLAKHLIIGVDFVPSDNFWLGVGFNPKTKMDMKLQGGGGGLSGFSAGAGVKIKMFDVGCSVAKYHPSAMSLMISVSMTLADFKSAATVTTREDNE
ncbi:MAG: type IX secretion system protein PorQ [bacterium]|nr:type IX secretion system protein PorQ [bacterium]